MRINVTAANIEAGKIGYDDTGSNAVALAIQAVCKKGVLVWAAPEGIRLDDGQDCETEFNCPEEVQTYLDALATGKDSQPFAFELDIESRYLP